MRETCGEFCNNLSDSSMPDRIVYLAIRKMDFIPKSDTKDVPFFYHHDHDARHWLRQGHGRHAALYKSDVVARCAPTHRARRRRCTTATSPGRKVG